MADEPAKVLDRDERQRKLNSWKKGIAVAGLAGTAFFAGLALEHTQASPVPNAPSATTNGGQGQFFSPQSGPPPSAGSVPPQTSSGGS